MAKRPAEEPLDGEQAYLKRSKLSKPIKSGKAGPPEDINSGEQLRQLLSFDQDLGRSKHGIQSFKAFLDHFSVEGNDNSRRVSILKNYLESNKTLHEFESDGAVVFLPDIMQTWSLASQSNDDSLLSAVPAVLSLLLRTISNILEFSEYGLRLGRTLLLKKQQELIARGLTANKTKDFVVSPPLRLLKELTIFDGGVLAKQVFRARVNTFKGLVRNLGLRYIGNSAEDLKKPSIRTNSLRFLLSMVRFLPVEAKRELLSQREIIYGLTKDMSEDPPFIIRDILETLRIYVLLDEALPRDAKTKVVNTVSLRRISMLYHYDQQEEESLQPKKPIEELAHEFLLLACTTLDLGVLTRQTGLYPKGVNPDETHDIDGNGPSIDLGLDSVDWVNRFTKTAPVRNVILSAFIANLHPWSSKRQGELLLSIFKAAPELVADYFFAKKDFSLDPKLTATWIGYSSFVFSTIQLPIPEYFGHHERYARLPPPLSIIMENILPQALSHKVLTRCLTQPYNSLITFFAVKMLCASFKKLRQALKMYQDAAKSSMSLIWEEAVEKLMNNFCQRCPSIRDVILAYRKMKVSDQMQREATTQLLVLYFEVTPRIALDTKFGVSAAVAELLHDTENVRLDPQQSILRAIEQENIFIFAHHSPGMRWFSKTEGLSLSPFTTMLKLAAEAPEGVPLLKLRSVLNSVAQENQILQMRTKISALDSLIFVLKGMKGKNSSATSYEFLDDCVSRCASNPIKYIFALEEISSGDRIGVQTLSLLLLTIVEQWPFLVKSSEEAKVRDVAHFISQYLASSLRILEDNQIIKIIVQRLTLQTEKYPMVAKLIEGSRKLAEGILVPESPIKPLALEQTTEFSSSMSVDCAKALKHMGGEVPIRLEDHNALTRWANKEVGEVIEDGHAGSLLLLLSSKHLSVRKEAATNLRKLAAKLNNSSFDEKDQIWLLLSEVLETSRHNIDKEPLATIISTFAADAIGVLRDPVHPLYPKINKFLSQGPIWHVDKIPLMHKILDDAPSLDDGRVSEINWLLTLLLAGLRNEGDLVIYHKRRVFERLLSVYNSPYFTCGLRDNTLKIFFRAASIGGGSNTLITRFSSLTWLQAQVALGGGTPLKDLIVEIITSCDKKRVGMWTRSRVGVIL